MARNVYGLDLGTYDIKIFDKKKDRIWHAKNVIAMKDKKYIFSVGDDAYEMYGKGSGKYTDHISDEEWCHCPF